MLVSLLSQKHNRLKIPDFWGIMGDTLRLKKEWEPKSRIFQNSDIFISRSF